jgi:hypothetical protein
MCFRFKEEGYRTLQLHISHLEKVENNVVVVSVDIEVMPPGSITVDV